MMNQFTASLWGDEAFSAVLSMKSLPEIVEILKRDTSPPLYNFLEYFVFKFFGSSEVAIRGLSFFLYLVAIIFVFLIGKHLWDKKTGLWATLLTFFNPFFFIYAFEGRMYATMTVGIVASMYFFISKKWLLYILATAWALYSHHFAIFILFVQGLWFLVQLVKGNKKDSLNIFRSFLLIILLYSPWILPLYQQTQMVGSGFWLGKPNLVDLRNLLYEYLAQGIKHPLSQVSLYLVFLTLLLRKWFKSISKTVILLLWFLVPILLTWVISQKFQPIFYNRYLLYTIPAAMLILVSNRRGIISNILLTAIATAFVVISVNYFFHPTKEPFRELASYVKESQREGDYLINYDVGNHKLWESKYYGIPAPIYVPEGDNLPYFIGTALMEPQDLAQKIPSVTKRVGAITTRPISEVSIPNYTVETQSSFGNLKFVWLGRK